MTVVLRELTASPGDRAQLAAFYADVYAREFPDPDERESLANMQRYLELKDTGWYGRNSYHVVLAERDGAIVGASIMDYLDEPNAGVIEFLFSVPAARGTGVGRALLQESERLAGADAQRGGRPLQWMAAEMNDPFIAPAVPDNMDPFQRVRIWDRWGFGVLECPYVQPALSADQQPADGLLLIAKCYEPDWGSAVPAEKVQQLVAAYMQWAMRIDEPQSNPQFRALATWLASRPAVSRLRLARYIGEFAAGEAAVPAFDVAELRSEQQPEFAAAIDVYRRAFDSPATSVQPAWFVRGLQRHDESGYRYHLWAVRARASGTIAGMASFFGFNRMGFGGYVVLERKLRGAGALRPLLARMEQQLIADQLCIEGWLIECETETTAAVFRRCGFYVVDVPYTQPLLPGATESASAPLILMYRPLGRSYATPNLEVARFLDAIAQILRQVYRVADPMLHPTLRSLAASLVDQRSVPLS